MKGISFAKDYFDSNRCYDIMAEIEKLGGYFYKFNGDDAGAVMSEVFAHAIEHYDSKKGALAPYIKKLAREVGKTDGKLIYSELIEQMASEGIDRYGKTVVVHDPTEQPYDEISEMEEELSQDGYEQVILLALQDMECFVNMCEALLAHDTSQRYFPNAFRAETVKLMGRYPRFTQMCLATYKKYGNEFRKFLSVSESSQQDLGRQVWRELDISVVQKNISRRVKFESAVSASAVITDPDTQPWVLKGALSGKRVIKVPYLEVYERVSDLIDSEETNVIKFCIEDNYIFRSLGGSWSLPNTSLFAQYDILKAEIETNLICDLNARYLMTGSKCIYLLVPQFMFDMVKETGMSLIPKRNIRGVKVEFEAIDITPAM